MVGGTASDFSGVLRVTVVLPRKQRSDHAVWLAAFAEIASQPDVGDRARRLVDEAVADIRRRLSTAGRRPAFGWSGGKDSLALEVVAEAAGIHECVLVISDLEYPAFLGWATDNMPAGLTVVVRPWDLEWLVSHPKMLFPADAETAGKWFAGIQHWGQRRFCETHDFDVLLMGRRRSDGNYCGKRGADMYRDRDGFVRWSPLADWSHEDVLTVLAGYDRTLPPCYTWPRGFRVGTGPWPARQWTGTVEQGWAEVAEIDRSIVETAAWRIPSAAAALERIG